MKIDRFDLEQDILNIQWIIDDIDTFLWLYSDGPKMDEDEVFNYVSGIRNVLKLKCEKAWETYCKTYELDHHRPTKQKKEVE